MGGGERSDVVVRCFRRCRRFVILTSSRANLYKGSIPELSNPLSCQLGPKEAPLEAELRSERD